MNSVKKLLIESLKDQREIFGDDLYRQVDLSKTATVPIHKSAAQPKEEKITTPVIKEKNVLNENFENAGYLDELYKQICNCQNCSLGSTRNKFVFGVGNPNADAMLIGEAPGAEEDKQGEPFVGRAGQLLNDIIKSIGFERKDVYIANILKCRPPNNRDPLPAEMATCMPYLIKQIDLIKPKVILCLGRIAANGLLDKKLSLTALRESTYVFNGVQVVATYHPAALLRNPNWKRGCWEDVKKFKKIYDELTGVK